MLFSQRLVLLTQQFVLSAQCSHFFVQCLSFLAVAFLATEGFRDVLALQRQSRRSIYDIHYRKPAPVVSRRDTFEIPERMGPHGEVVTALDEATAEDRSAARWKAPATNRSRSAS